jgi:hypothetical protein
MVILLNQEAEALRKGDYKGSAREDRNADIEDSL